MFRSLKDIISIEKNISERIIKTNYLKDLYTSRQNLLNDRTETYLKAKYKFEANLPLLHKHYGLKTQAAQAAEKSLTD